MKHEYDIIEEIPVKKAIEIIEVEKFNPNHDALGRFSSGGGGGAAGGASARSPFPLDDDDDDLMPWNSTGSASRSTSEEKKPKEPTNKEIKAELKALDQHKHLKVYVTEMPANHTIYAEIIGTLPGGNEITFHDDVIRTAQGLKGFKEMYAKSAKQIDGYHASGYRGL